MGRSDSKDKPKKKKKDDDDQRYKSAEWCFTSYRFEHVPFLREVARDAAGHKVFLPDVHFVPPDYVKYLVFQIEQCPTTKRLHIQGYVEYTNVRDFNREVKSDVGLFGAAASVASFTKARGTRQDNYAYCTKAESRLRMPSEFGAVDESGEGNPCHPQSNVTYLYVRPGTSDETEHKAEERNARIALQRIGEAETPQDRATARAELEKLALIMLEELMKNTQYDEISKVADVLFERIKEDGAVRAVASKALTELKKSYQFYTNQFAYWQAKAAQKQIEQNNRLEVVDVQTYVYWGPPGTGKSTLAHVKFAKGGLYIKPKGKWWDQYNGHLTVLLDDPDLSGKDDYLTPSMLQQLLQGFRPYYVEKKGGMVSIKYTTVVITTNFHFEEWFNGWKGVSADTKGSIYSRIGAENFIFVGGEDRRLQHRKRVRDAPAVNEMLNVVYV